MAVRFLIGIMVMIVKSALASLARGHFPRSKGSKLAFRHLLIKSCVINKTLMPITGRLEFHGFQNVFRRFHDTVKDLDELAISARSL